MIRFNCINWNLKGVSSIGSSVFLHFISEDGKEVHDNALTNFMHIYYGDTQFRAEVNNLIYEYNKNISMIEKGIGHV